MNPWPRFERLEYSGYDKVRWGWVGLTILIMVIAGIVGYAAVWSLETVLARYEVSVLDQRSHHH